MVHDVSAPGPGVRLTTVNGVGASGYGIDFANVLSQAICHRQPTSQPIGTIFRKFASGGLWLPLCRGRRVGKRVCLGESH